MLMPRHHHHPSRARWMTRRVQDQQRADATDVLMTSAHVTCLLPGNMQVYVNGTSTRECTLVPVLGA
jgi:hypothetical protein